MIPIKKVYTIDNHITPYSEYTRGLSIHAYCDSQFKHKQLRFDQNIVKEHLRQKC